MDPETFAFTTALLVNFVDTLGLQFLAPVSVPYGRWLGASLSVIAAFNTVRGISQIISNLWMPRLSDSRGRKIVIMLSLSGSCAAYLVQALACRISGFEIGSVFIGKFLAGFFGGTMPVVRAYVTELSMHDDQLLKRRLTYMLVSNQAAGIVLAPIAGSLATLGLDLPYYVCCVVAAFALTWACFYFVEVSQLRKADAGSESRASSLSVNAATVVQNGSRPSQAGSVRQRTVVSHIGSSRSVLNSFVQRDHEATEEEEDEYDDEDDDESSDEEHSEREVLKARPNPWCDKVVLLQLLATFCIYAGFAGFVLLLPVMLQNPSFGLQGSTQEETEGKVAKAVGLLIVPQGLMNMIMSILVYLPLSTRCGEANLTMTCGILLAFFFWMMGSCTMLWHIGIVSALQGSCMGLVLPTISPLMARYASQHYADQMAHTISIPVLGMSLAMAFGQNILAFIANHFGLQSAWLGAAVLLLTFTLSSFAAIRLVATRSPKTAPISPYQQKMLLATGGVDIDNFVNIAADRLRSVLSQNQGKLWNHFVQFVILEQISQIVPATSEWNDGEDNLAYFEDLYKLLERYPDQLEQLCEKFPQCRTLQSSILVSREAEFTDLEINAVNGGPAVPWVGV